jgi:hypothetical protein
LGIGLYLSIHKFCEPIIIMYANIGHSKLEPVWITPTKL